MRRMEESRVDQSIFVRIFIFIRVVPVSEGQKSSYRSRRGMNFGSIGTTDKRMTTSSAISSQEFMLVYAPENFTINDYANYFELLKCRYIYVDLSFPSIHSYWMPTGVSCS